MDARFKHKYGEARRRASLKYNYRRKSPQWLAAHVVDLVARRALAMEVLAEHAASAKGKGI
jgi:hypothetical protein